MKKIFCLLLCALLFLAFSGCTGRELYERLLIHGIGVDAEADGSVTITVRSSVSAEDAGEEYFKCQGQSVLEALSSLSLSTGRKPFYAHNYLVVFGKSCAEKGLDDCLDFFVRYYNTRPAVQMYLAEDKAEDILSFEVDGKYLKMGELQQLGDSSRDTGRTVGTEILDFVAGVKRKGFSPVLPVLRAEEDGVKIVSTAYFDGYALKGFLTLDETRGYLAVKKKLENGEVVVDGRGGLGKITLSLSNGSGKICRLDEQGDLPRFLLQVQITGDVSAVSGGKDQLKPEDYPELEKLLAEEVQAEIEGALQKTVLTDSCDIFGFGALLYRQDPDYWRQVSAQWNTLMTQCGYEIEVTAKVNRLEQ